MIINTMNDFEFPIHDFEIPMIQLKEITCKICKSNVKRSIFNEMYKCRKCQLLTNHIDVVVVPTVGLLRINTA